MVLVNGFVCQIKKGNECGHVPEHFICVFHKLSLIDGDVCHHLTDLHDILKGFYIDFFYKDYFTPLPIGVLKIFIYSMVVSKKPLKQEQCSKGFQIECDQTSSPFQLVKETI